MNKPKYIEHTPEAIVEGNTKIAIFMGAVIKTSDQMASGVAGIERNSEEMWADFGGEQYGKCNHLLYRMSWDSLMPVIDRVKNKTEEPEDIDHLRDILWWGSIEQVWAAVVDIITDLK